MISSFFFVRYAGLFRKISFRDISHLEACKNYVKIHTTDQVFFIPGTLKGIEASLPRDPFCRIHRSFIVSLDYVSAFDKRTVYLGDKRLPIGDEFRANLEKYALIVEKAPAAQSRQRISLN
jgi:DNA-binding LytR/AlgR family response regulator